MSRSNKSIMQYCALKDFFFKLLRNMGEKMKTTTTTLFWQSVQNLTFLYTLFTQVCKGGKSDHTKHYMLSVFLITSLTLNLICLNCLLTRKTLFPPFLAPNSKPFLTITPKVITNHPLLVWKLVV